MRRVLDTNAILYFLGGKLAEPLPPGEYVISVITEMELLSYPLLDASAQAAISDFLSQIAIIGLDNEVKDIAIRLRREQQLKLPDAIVAATAFSLGAPLVTNDVRLHRIPGLFAERLELNEND